MIKTRCPNCGKWLTVDESPAPPDGFAVEAESKPILLRSYLEAAAKALDEGGLLIAVHATITAAGMAQAEMPEVAGHDCYGENPPDVVLFGGPDASR